MHPTISAAFVSHSLAGVAFLYFIFMDEDLELLIRTTATCAPSLVTCVVLISCDIRYCSCSYPRAEFIPSYNSSTEVGMNDPTAYRLFERYLLE